MNNLAHLLTKPTNAALTEGTHNLKLISIECPNVADDKTPYIRMTFALENGAKTSKNLFEKEIEILTNSAKHYYNMAETNASLSELIPLMQTDFFPITIIKKEYTALNGEQMTALNWYYFKEEIQQSKGGDVNER